MNLPKHRDWLSSWFHIDALSTKKDPTLLRREQGRRVFVVDPPDYIRTRHHRQSTFTPRTQPTSSRMNSTFDELPEYPRSCSRTHRDIHEIQTHTEAPRRENPRPVPAPRVRPVSPRMGSYYADFRQRSRSRSAAHRETPEVRQAHPTRSAHLEIPNERLRRPRERTPVDEREPSRPGNWIPAPRQGRNMRRHVSFIDEDVSFQSGVSRATVQEQARGPTNGEERRGRTTRRSSPFRSESGYSGEGLGSRRVVQRSPQTQRHSGRIEERSPRAERPQIIHHGHQRLSHSWERFPNEDHGRYPPRVPLQQPLARVFRRHRNRQERFIDERGPLDRWR
ncbi:hypothetical protein N7454_003102 [Penicillium verhagenii]|nr:hypothetical protein N7454_003102 [Penicillium verhagenii]